MCSFFIHSPQRITLNIFNYCNDIAGGYLLILITEHSEGGGYAYARKILKPFFLCSRSDYYSGGGIISRSMGGAHRDYMYCRYFFSELVLQAKRIQIKRERKQWQRYQIKFKWLLQVA